MTHPNYCECCHQICTDADRAQWADRFGTFKERREREWAELSKGKPPAPPGHFAFTNLPRELRDKVYNLLLEPKTGTARYVTHDHQFPTQILYLNYQIRDEFLDALFKRIWVMCQYSTNIHHVQLELPPPTLFPRVRQIWARLTVCDSDSFTWAQALHDADLVLTMFPNATSAIFVFRGVQVGEKSWDETELVRGWEESGLRGREVVRQVTFQLEVPRGVHGRQKMMDEYTCEREDVWITGSKWKKMEKKMRPA